jgi:drug/metabolite transporter (DMT)-like permease
MLKIFKAELLLVFITLIWGGTFVIIKNALADVPPFLYSGLRFALASGIGLALWWKFIRGITRTEIWQGILLGAFFSVGFLLQTWGLNYTTVSKSSFITGAMVIFAPITYWIVERRPISLAQKIGVIVVITGLWIFTNPDISNMNKGDIATLCCSVCWGIYITYTDVFTRDSTAIGILSVRLAVVQFIMTTVVAFGAYLCFEGSAVHFWGDVIHVLPSKPFIIAVLYTGILGSVVATYIQTRFQRETTPVKAALIFSIEPILASAMAVVLLNESFKFSEIVGGTLVIGGVLAAEIGDALWKKELSS